MDPSPLLKGNPDGVDSIGTEHLSLFWGQSGEEWVWGVWGARVSELSCEANGREFISDSPQSDVN